MKIDELSGFIYRFNKYNNLYEVHETTHSSNSEDAICYFTLRFAGFSNEREDELFILPVEVAKNNNFYFTKINNVNKKSLEKSYKKIRKVIRRNKKTHFFQFFCGQEEADYKNCLLCQRFCMICTSYACKPKDTYL